ncbi:MAG: hypothetical protein ACR2H0_01415 [Candidatus Limnocylindrales bacterium]
MPCLSGRPTRTWYYYVRIGEQLASGHGFVTDYIWNFVAGPTLALPDEPVEVLLDLARNFEAQAVVLVEGRGRYPHDLATAQDSCFKPLASAITGGATVYLIDRECVR